MREFFYRCLRIVWLFRKKLALAQHRPVPPMPGALDPRSPYYLNPEEYSCKPGVVTWEYLNAVYYQAFPELQEKTNCRS